MKHKYVRHEDFGVILFPADTELYHSHIGREMMRQSQGGKLVSAGFVHLMRDRVMVSGRSESLNLGPQTDDENVIAAQLGYL